MGLPTEAQPDLRAEARRIFDRAVAAADPASALKKSLAVTPLPVPPEGGRSLLIAIGKAAPAMLREALLHVTGPHQALAVTHEGNLANVARANVFHAGHPLPDRNGLQAGQRIVDMLRGARETDRVIALISGGGSALVPAPVAGISLADKIAVNDVLLSSGLEITDVNLIRQQLSRLKGGGMLRHAAPAPVQAYILSDVIGDDLRAVASGPTVAPIGDRAQASALCHEAGIWAHLPGVVRAHLEQSVFPTPDVPAPLNHLIGSNRISLAAAQDAARQGFDSQIVSDTLCGDVEVAAQRILAAAQATPRDHPHALLFGGETTVQLAGQITGDLAPGLGGRNQELALRVAQLAQTVGLRGKWLFLSAGTDGRDGPTPAAGGMVDSTTLARIAAAGMSIDTALAHHDSHHALAASGDLLLTGATGTNVADIQIMLLGP